MIEFQSVRWIAGRCSALQDQKTDFQDETNGGPVIVHSNEAADRRGVSRIQAGCVHTAIQIVELLVALSNTWQSDQQAGRDEHEAEDEHEADQDAVQCREVRSVGKRRAGV